VCASFLDISQTVTVLMPK